jgi:hypothetical protein
MRYLVIFVLLFLLGGLVAASDQGAMPPQLGSQEQMRLYIWFMLGAVGSASGGTAFVSGAVKGNPRGLWITAMLASLLCMGGTVFIWVLELSKSPDADRIDIPIYNQLDLDRYIGEYASQDHAEAPLYIPTGVFVQSVEFQGSNDVLITGYVWQKYTDGLHDNLSRGFVMPEGDNIYGEEAYRHREGAVETIGWYFSTTLRQEFYYNKYPFDRQDIWLRLWHQDFAANVVLVPDFAAYVSTQPSALMGIENDFVLERWRLERSFFSYHENSYNANFGISDYIGQSNFPELYFNIGVQRDFVDAFISFMIPALIVLMMLFGVQIVLTQDPERMERYGGSIMELLGYSASLFFIAILAQINLRNQIAAPTLIYLEYFYFIVYVMIFLVSVNGIIFITTDRFWVIEYKDNLIPKLLYWPFASLLMLLLTIYSFY